MSTLGSGTPSSTAAADTSKHWVPHGPVLTSCVVGVNVLMILIFFFLWRFFSGKRGASASADAAADDDDASSSASLPVASPWATRRRRGDLAGAQRLDAGVVAAALPVYVYSSAAGADEAIESECAVCIVELRDGESARRLPRCGHQFHAGCVGEWLRLHDTCPLCAPASTPPPPPRLSPTSPGARTMTSPRIAPCEALSDETYADAGK